MHLNHDARAEKSGCPFAPHSAVTRAIAQMGTNMAVHTRSYNKHTITLSWQDGHNMHACGCRDKAEQYISSRRIVCRGIFGSFSPCFPSVFRPIIAAVRVQMYTFNTNLVQILTHVSLDLHTIMFSLTSLNH